jgi:hypothetical protein
MPPDAVANIGLALISLAVGGFIAWWITHDYYAAGTQDLLEVRTLVNTLARALQATGQIEGVWDGDNLVSWVVRGEAVLSAKAVLEAYGHEVPVPKKRRRGLWRLLDPLT